jgi:hypothetical protein
MTSDDAAALATQQSIKAYVDNLTSDVAFSVAKSTQLNITPDSDITVTWGTERFDLGSDFASNTFTAPVTGKYLLTCRFYWVNVDAGATYYRFRFNTSNFNYYWDNQFNDSSDPAWYARTYSILADMDASDTCTIIVRQVGGATQTDLEGGNSSHLTGHLVR